MIYGYARVSSRGQAQDGNGLEGQEQQLRANGAVEIYKDVFTGVKLERPGLEELLSNLAEGDTLIVTKLDRIARSAIQGGELITALINKGVKVNILNIGVMDNTANSTLIRNIFFAFAQFERDMIVERTREGKEIARTKAGYKEGMPKKYTQHQLDHAVELLKKHTYREVEALTKISKSTIIREVRRVRQLESAIQ